MALELRPYQVEAIAAIEEAERRGVRRPLLGLPTGTGKTVIFAALIRKRAGRALVVAATPERADNASLGEVWDEVVYSRSLLEMIRAGYLVDLRGLRVRLDVDFSRLRVSHGDFVDTEAAAVLTAADAPAHACDAYLEHAPGRKALLFTPTVEL